MVIDEKYFEGLRQENRDAFKSIVVYKLYQVSTKVSDPELGRAILLLGSFLVDDPKHSRFLYSKASSVQGNE